MALSDLDKVAVRRYAGYPAASPDPAFVDPAVVQVPGFRTTLNDWMNDVSADQESVLRDVYLDNLETLETAVLDVQDTIDSTAAGTWQSNPREMSDRIRLFNSWRRNMCSFIGVEPGPGLGRGGMNLVRG